MTTTQKKLVVKDLNVRKFHFKTDQGKTVKEMQLYQSTRRITASWQTVLFLNGNSTTLRAFAILNHLCSKANETNICICDPKYLCNFLGLSDSSESKVRTTISYMKKNAMLAKLKGRTGTYIINPQIRFLAGEGSNQSRVVKTVKHTEQHFLVETGEVVGSFSSTESYKRSFETSYDDLMDFYIKNGGILMESIPAVAEYEDTTPVFTINI